MGRLKQVLGGFTVLGVLGGIGYAGYRVGTGGGPVPVAALDASAPSTVTPDSTPGAAAPAATAGQAPSAAGQPSTDTYEAIVKARGLFERQEKLKGFFPDTAAGRNLTEYLTLLNSKRSPPSSPEFQLWKARSEELFKSGPQTFEMIRGGVAALTPEFAVERQFLVQYVAAMESVDKESRLQFLAREAQRPARVPAADTAHPGVFDSSNALVGIFNVETDPALRERQAREALTAQADPKIRETLVTAVSRFDMDMAERLRKEFVP